MAFGLSDPAAFARLRQTRHRARSGPLWVAWQPASSDACEPRVAYAIGKRVGGAVVRNRLRRRLRAIVAEVAPPAGDYLVGASPEATELPFPELKVLVTGLLEQVTAPVGAGR